MHLCSADGCGREATRTRKTWCETHYYRLRRNGSLELPPKESKRLPRPPCTAEGCDRDARLVSGSLCHMHERRLARTGRVDGMGSAPENCVIDGCPDPARTIAGHCGKHHERIKRHGAPDVVLAPRWTGERASYTAVHQRLARVRGRASTHRCVDCSKAASQWSYGHARGPGHRECEAGPYSVDLADYDPRCVSCHKKFDLAHLGKVITTKKEHAHG